MKIKMSIDKFFKLYGHLLPNDYKRFMRTIYDNNLKTNGSMLMPDPSGKNIIEIVKTAV